MNDIDSNKLPDELVRIGEVYIHWSTLLYVVSENAPRIPVGVLTDFHVQRLQRAADVIAERFQRHWQAKSTEST